jgi:hypothetical protein
VTDLSFRPELGQLASKIAVWRDRFVPPAGEENEDLLNHPYLGPHFEFIPKCPEEARYLRSIFNYTFGCFPSLGLGGSSISGMKYSLPRIVRGVTQQLYVEDQAYYYRSLESFMEIEFELERTEDRLLKSRPSRNGLEEVLL